MNPDTALHDSDRDIIYVSNINGKPTDKDVAGRISRMTKDGQIQDMEWVTGLHALKGLVRYDNFLSVSDRDRLVSIDIDTGEIVDSCDAENAKILNDLAVDDEGVDYVFDILTDSIYRHENDSLSLWLQDEALQFLNRLQLDGDQLLIAPWGEGLQEDFSTKVLGHLIAASQITASRIRLCLARYCLIRGPCAFYRDQRIADPETVRRRQTFASRHLQIKDDRWMLHKYEAGRTTGCPPGYGYAVEID